MRHDQSLNNNKILIADFGVAAEKNNYINKKEL